MRLHTVFLFIFCLQIYGQDSSLNFTPDYFEQQRFAHRGGYAYGPENTLQTILNTVKNGTTAIEVDVQMTKDNQLVLFHDQKINKILNTDKDINIWELKLKELQKIPLRDTSKGVQYVCSLKTLIDTLNVIIPNSKTKNLILELDFKPYGDQTKKSVKALSDIIDAQLAIFGEDLYNELI